jgi:hypothetical protein
VAARSPARRLLAQDRRDPVGLGLVGRSAVLLREDVEVVQAVQRDVRVQLEEVDHLAQRRDPRPALTQVPLLARLVGVLLGVLRVVLAQDLAQARHLAAAARDALCRGAQLDRVLLVVLLRAAQDAAQPVELP